MCENGNHGNESYLDEFIIVTKKLSKHENFIKIGRAVSKYENSLKS